MSKKTYNIEKLGKSGYIDTSQNELFFYQRQDYFDKLTEFMEETQHTNIPNYTPAFVVNNKEDQDRFLAESSNIRARLMQLGMHGATRELNNMEDAIRFASTKAFADGQIKFAATMNIYESIISAAEV